MARIAVVYDPGNIVDLQHIPFNATGAMVVIREDELDPRRIRRIARDLGVQIMREVRAKKVAR